LGLWMFLHRLITRMYANTTPVVALEATGTPAHGPGQRSPSVGRPVIASRASADAIRTSIFRNRSGAVAVGERRDA